MTNTVQIKLIRPTTTKLQFVKLIKECSGLGLKDSKDLCDLLHNNPTVPRTMPIRQTELDQNNNKVDYKSKFILGLKEIDGQFSITGDTQWERNIKMLQLGVGEKEDYIEFLKDYIFDHFKDSEYILKLALTKLNKQDLEEVVSNLELNYLD